MNTFPPAGDDAGWPARGFSGGAITAVMRRMTTNKQAVMEVVASVFHVKQRSRQVFSVAVLSTKKVIEKHLISRGDWA